LKNVRGEIPAASAIASTVTASSPRSSTSRCAASTIASVRARFLRSRSPSPGVEVVAITPQ
jgi:hypothetical protein